MRILALIVCLFFIGCSDRQVVVTQQVEQPVYQNYRITIVYSNGTKFETFVSSKYEPDIWVRSTGVSEITNVEGAIQFPSKDATCFILPAEKEVKVSHGTK